jgi:hypothetical protein
MACHSKIKSKSVSLQKEKVNVIFRIEFQNLYDRRIDLLTKLRYAQLSTEEKL